MMEQDLAWLLGPVSSGEFFCRYFEKDIFHLSDRGAAFYDAVFAQTDLDKIVHQSPEFVANHLRYCKAEEAMRRNHLSPHPQIPTPVTAQSLPGAMQAAYRSGYSLILDDVVTAWWPLAQFARAIETTIYGQVTASMLFSPAHAHAVPVHYDGFDVFILQIAGCKEWTVYRPQTLLPIGPQPLGDADLGAPIASLTLRPGDLLYMPRGFVHEALSGDEPSLHLTVGLHTYRWYELLADLVEGLAEKQVALRQSVPVSVCRAIATGAGQGSDQVREQLSALLEHCLVNGDLAAPVSRHARKFIDGLQPLGLDSFAAPELPATLDVDRPVVRNPGMPCYVYDDAGKAVIGFPGGHMRGPAAIRPALEFIAGTEAPFCAADLPGDLSQHSKNLLVLRLIRDGLLRLPAIEPETAPLVFALAS